MSSEYRAMSEVQRFLPRDKIFKFPYTHCSLLITHCSFSGQVLHFSVLLYARSGSQLGFGTSIVVSWASGMKGTSVASISSAPTRRDSSNSSRVLSCALTPGRSINQPIHQSSDLFITALYFMGLPWRIRYAPFFVRCLMSVFLFIRLPGRR